MLHLPEVPPSGRTCHLRDAGRLSAQHAQRPSSDQAAASCALQVAAFSNVDSGSIEPEGSEVSQDESSEESQKGSSKSLRAGSQHHVIDMPGRQKSQVRPEQYVLPQDIQN